MTEFEIKQASVVLRPAEIADEPFLEALYADSRRGELSPLGWNRGQEDAFFSGQFRLQKRAYEMQFPGADYSVIELGKTPVGRQIVCRARNEIRLIDIALLADFRGRGVGGILLEQLKAEATVETPLNLCVLKTNPAAKRFYERSGLAVVGEADLHFSMQWRKI